MKLLQPENLWTLFGISVILDCFIGSGTTAAVAQKLGRRWIGCDINKGATSNHGQAVTDNHSGTDRDADPASLSGRARKTELRAACATRLRLAGP